MGLGTIVRRAVATAHRITSGGDGVQVDVSHHVALSQSMDGTWTYASAVTLPALYEESQRRFVNTQMIGGGGGTEQVARGKLTFLVDITIQRDDEFTLPDGYRAPVLDVKRLVDPTTGNGFVTEVFLGWQGRNL